MIVVERVEGEERVNEPHDQPCKDQNERIISASRENRQHRLYSSGNETNVLSMEIVRELKLVSSCVVRVDAV